MNRLGSTSLDIARASRRVWTIFTYTGEAVPVTYLIEYALFETDGLLTICMMVPGHKFTLELPETTALAEHRVKVSDLVLTHAT